MTRMVDLFCKNCGHEQLDQFLREDEVVPCILCSGVTEQVWWKRPRGPAQWDDSTAVLVFRGPDGSISYPGSHEAKQPKGYERVYLRSLQEVNRFEKEQGVTNHCMHFDGNGRAVDDYVGGQKLVH